MVECAKCAASAVFGSLAFTSQFFPRMLTIPVRPGIVVRREAATFFEVYGKNVEMMKKKLVVCDGISKY